MAESTPKICSPHKIESSTGKNYNMIERTPRSCSPHNIEPSTEENHRKIVTATKISEEILPQMLNIYSEILCPICYQVIEDAYITHCGHTFCYQCIIDTINNHKRCPKCYINVLIEEIHPNILLNELISKYKINKTVTIVENKPFPGNFAKYIMAETKNLNLADVNHMINILLEYKQKIEIETSTTQNALLVEFLKKLLKKKEEEKSKISYDINIIKQDLQLAQKNLLRNTNQYKTKNPLRYIDSIESSSIFTSTDVEETDNIMVMNTQSHDNISKLETHFEDFISTYFEMHSSNAASNIDANNSDIGDTSEIIKHKNFDVNSFRDILSKCYRYSSFKCKAILNSPPEEYIPSNIISSIVFDKDYSHFAVGGVTKKIKIYNLNLIDSNTNAFQNPLKQIALSNKISCLSWNFSHRNILASSDYEGVVNIWNVDTCIRTRCFNEHSKRCWSIDFNENDTNLIVSGSDDHKVKLWSINENNAIATLETKANICCVKFNPNNSYQLAFGSADHHIHYYDLRNIKNYLYIFKGHKRAVSYVRFLNSNEIISASTDGQLKYWNINLPDTCLRSFKGHLNEKNFVGLTVGGDYIACGSEDNSLYVYYKGLSKPLFNYKINTNENIKEKEKINDLNEFVSAVCWKKDSDIVIAANSRGLIKVLEII